MSSSSDEESSSSDEESSSIDHDAAGCDDSMPQGTRRRRCENCGQRGHASDSCDYCCLCQSYVDEIGDDNIANYSCGCFDWKRLGTYPHGYVEAHSDKIYCASCLRRCSSCNDQFAVCQDRDNCDHATCLLHHFDDNDCCKCCRTDDDDDDQYNGLYRRGDSTHVDILYEKIDENGDKKYTYDAQHNCYFEQLLTFRHSDGVWQFCEVCEAQGLGGGAYKNYNPGTFSGKPPRSNWTYYDQNDRYPPLPQIIYL